MSDSDFEEPLLELSTSDSLKASLPWNNGYLCAFGTAFNFSIISVLVKLMQHQLNSIEITLVRASISFVLCLLLSHLQGIDVRGKKENRFLLVARGMCGTFSIIFYYISLFLLPISDAVVIGATHPLMTALAAKIFLNEQVSALVVCGALLSFSGVGVISYTPSGSGSGSVWDGTRLNGVAMAITSAICATGGSLCIRVLGHKETAITITSYLQGIATVVCISLVFSLQALNILQPSSLEEVQPIVWLYLAFVGGLAWSGQLLLTRSLQLLPAAIALGIGLSTVACSFLFGVFLFGDAVTIQGVLGTLMVLMGVLTLCV